MPGRSGHPEPAETSTGARRRESSLDSVVSPSTCSACPEPGRPQAAPLALPNGFTSGLDARATARQAIPSCRPERAQTFAPFRLYRNRGADTAARAASMVLPVSGQPGASAITVQSTLTGLPATETRPDDTRQQARLSAPRQSGSVSGNSGPDVAQTRRPEQRVCYGMADDVAVTVALQAPTLDAHAAEDQRPVRGRQLKGWMSKPWPTREVHRPPPDRDHLGHAGLSASARSSGLVTLILRLAGDAHDPPAHRFDQGGIVGRFPPPAWAARRAAAEKAWGVWTASSRARSSVTRRPSSWRCLIVSDTGTQGPPRQPRPRSPRSRHAHMWALTKRAGGVVDDHDLTLLAGTASSPARTDAVRVGPPATTHCSSATVLVGTWRRDDQHNACAGAVCAASSDQSTTSRPAQQHELFVAAEAGTAAAGDHDGPTPVTGGPASDGPLGTTAALRRASFRPRPPDTPMAKVSSETRIWRARLSILFSPAERPLSLSLFERLRTTSATW